MRGATKGLRTVSSQLDDESFLGTVWGRATTTADSRLLVLPGGMLMMDCNGNRPSSLFVTDDGTARNLKMLGPNCVRASSKSHLDFDVAILRRHAWNRFRGGTHASSSSSCGGSQIANCEPHIVRCGSSCSTVMTAPTASIMLSVTQ